MYQTGIALSGGGARGFAHLGILQGLLEKGIKPEIYSGVSAGAIVGAFIASGRQPSDIHDIIRAGRLFKYTRIQIPKTGLLRLDGLQKVLEKEIPFERIEDLPMPLIIGTTNMTEGIMEYRDKGPLVTTILASASIPILFSPVHIDGCDYVDGGLLDNIAVKPLLSRCKRIIVSNISPLQKHQKIDGIIQMIARTFLMSIHARISEARNHADLYIEPEELTEFEVLGVGKADEMFEIGYNTIMKMPDSSFELFTKNVTGTVHDLA